MSKTSRDAKQFSYKAFKKKKKIMGVMRPLISHITIKYVIIVMWLKVYIDF